MKPKIKKLKNGTTVIVTPRKNTEMVTCLVGVRIGSINEKKSQNGLAHFFEHMCFKGTNLYKTPEELVEKIDSLSVVSNAGTSESSTGYFLTGRKKDFEKIFSLVTEIFLHSTYPEKELKKERGVILSEIDMYEDDPQDVASQEILNLLYGDTSLGRPILGSKKNVKNFTREDFLKFLKRFYHPRNTIISVSGGITANQVFREAEKLYIKKSKRKLDEREKIDFSHKKIASVIKKKTEQTVLCLAFETLNYNHKDFYTLQVLNCIFGYSGFSDRLHIGIREKLGACYYVRSRLECLEKRGYMEIQTGIKQTRVLEILREILKESKKMTEELISKEELTKAKNVLIGRKLLSAENSQTNATDYFIQYALIKKTQTPKEYINSIKKVTRGDILKLAKKIFKTGGARIVVVGQTKVTPKKLEEELKFLN